MLNYGQQWLDQEDYDAVLSVLKSDFLTQGPAVSKFEEDLTAVTGAKYAVAVSNGTAALHLAVAALRLKPGKHGITTPITFAASANAMLYNSITPEFCDIDPVSWCLSPEKLKQSIHEDVELVIPVHFTGTVADMESIKTIADDLNAYVIEDAAHAIGSKYISGEYVGSCKFADLTTFSFHPVKTITCGEGGAITTNDETLYQRLIDLRSHGITKDPSRLSTNPGPWYYEMQQLGFNYRLTDIQAALGTSQLKKLRMFSEKRQEIIRFYNERFTGIQYLTTPSDKQLDNTVNHLYVILLDFDQIGKDRSQVMQELREEGVGTQVHYIPVYQLPFYRQMNHLGNFTLENSEHYYNQCLSIPLFPSMTREDTEQVVHAVKKVISNS